MSMGGTSNCDASDGIIGGIGVGKDDTTAGDNDDDA